MDTLINNSNKKKNVEIKTNSSLNEKSRFYIGGTYFSTIKMIVGQYFSYKPIEKFVLTLRHNVKIYNTWLISTINSQHVKSINDNMHNNA